MFVCLSSELVTCCAWPQHYSGVILDQVVLCVHAALLRFAAQSMVYSLEVHEASGDQAEFMKDFAEQAYANWKKLGYVNHPGWSILNQDAYAAIMPRNAEQFAELLTTCVSGHQNSHTVRPYTCLPSAYCLHTLSLQHADGARL